MAAIADKTEQQREKMLTHPVPSLVMSLSAPTIASMLITVIYNTADTWFVSHIGTSASAAVGVVYSIMAVIQAVGFGLGMGSGSLISMRMGEGKREEARQYASSAFFAAIIFGAVVGALGLSFLRPLLRLLGSTETILPYAVDYAKWILLCAPVTCASFVLNNIVRSQGKALFSSFGLCIGGILNMGLDPLLIFVFKLGIGGAAIATALSQMVSFTILLCITQSGKGLIRISPRSMSREFSCYAQIIATGVPTIARQSLGSVASAALNIKAAAFGDAAVAAMTIAGKVYMLIRNIVIGAGQGFMPVAGYNYGAGNKKRTANAFVFTAAVGSVVCVACSVVMWFMADSLITWFRDDPLVVEIGAKVLKFSAFSVPFLAYSTLVNQMYQCLGFKAPATFLASCRQGIFFLPIVLIVPLFAGLLGVQIAQPAADICTFIISVPFQIMFFRKHLSTSEE